MAELSLSSSLASAFYRFFAARSYSTTSLVGYSESKFNNYNFNPVFLRIKSNEEGELLEIPSLIRDYNLINIKEKIGELVIPLSIINFTYKKTTDSIFKCLFESFSNLGLRKVTTSKNEIYYGAPGLILDKNFEPIVIGISEFKAKNDFAEFNRNVLKVNPKVFTSDNIVEKGIIKKFIPYCTRSRMFNIDGVTKVEIEDINHYVVKPIIPKVNIQESIKEILHTYKDEILSTF